MADFSRAFEAYIKDQPVTEFLSFDSYHKDPDLAGKSGIRVSNGAMMLHRGGSASGYDYNECIITDEFGIVIAREESTR